MEKLAIIGCGTMGHSIALNAAWRGISVTLQGVDLADIGRGQLGINRNLETLVQNHLLPEDESQKVRNRITVTTSIEKAAKDSSFIIEAIPENIELKKELFRHLDRICGPEVILASNTSGFSPTVLASVTGIPERVLVTHFWNPAHLIPLVELVRGEKTSDVTVKRGLDLLRLMKKRPIEVKKEVPGFIANRLQFALFREAQFLFEEGFASKEDIDAAVIYSIGRRLSVTGPFISADMGGLDVFAAISDYLFSDLSKSETASDGLKNMVKDNKLGSKTGIGYYLWDAGFIEKMNRRREAELIRLLIQDDQSDS